MSGLVRGIGVLTGGTVLAQVIPLLMLPVLSRLYVPETFAVLGLMMMGAYFTASLSTGNYEYAIATSRSAARARTLATITILFSLGFAAVYELVLVLFYQPIAEVLKLGAHAPWMFAVPVTLLCGSFAAAGNYWLLRAGKHGLQAGIKFTHAGVNAVFSLALGLMGWVNGLLWGFVGGIALSAAWGIFWAWQNGLRLVHLDFRKHLARVMLHYREFPLFGSLPTALNNLAVQLPLIIVAASYALATTGHFSITRNLLSGGVVLVSASIGQVVLKHLSERRHARQKLWPFLLRVLAGLIGVGVAVGAGIYMLGPWFFSFYLGAGWKDSGEILRVLSVGVPFVLVGGSLAPALVAIRRLKIMAGWQAFYLALSLGLFLFADLPFTQFLWCIVGVEALAYSVYIPLIAWQVWKADLLLLPTK